MKSIRLNKEIRNDIVENIKAAYLDENKRPLYIEDAKATLEEAIIVAYKKKNAALYKEYEASNFKDCFKKSSCVRYINNTGSYIYAYPTYTEVNGVRIYDHVILDDQESGVFIALNDENAAMPATLKKHLKDAKALRKVRKVRNDEISAYDLEMDRYIADVRQIINGTNTTGQLVTVWPEVEKFFPKGASNPSVITLPSVNINALNRKLGTVTP